MTLSAEKFLHRFLQHVLPRGLQRVIRRTGFSGVEGSLLVIAGWVADGPAARSGTSAFAAGTLRNKGRRLGQGFGWLPVEQRADAFEPSPGRLAQPAEVAHAPDAA